MCGICGVFYLDKRKHIDEKLIKAMCNVIRHRGPDDEGMLIDGHIGLGMRRLSIIDLSGGHQPIHNEDKTIWVILNGEIYNFAELKRFLESKGHKFYTFSDTETIAHCYEEFGDACVEKLRGMFGFAIWDKNKQKLLLARDRIGIKPLHYIITNGKLIFGSEIKSILQVPDVERKVDLEALHSFLTFNYIPAPRTIFEGIYKLPPAHILTCLNGEITIKHYWDLAMSDHLAKSEEEYAAQLLEILKESAKLHLISDVPLGVLLSGGVDSSSVTALVCSVTNGLVKTFSIGFEEKSYNELEYARIVANHFNTDHHEFIVKPDAVELLPKLVQFFDEPFADSSAVPTYYVSKLAKEHVTVALSGEGGDEVFAGYETYAADRLADYYQRIPKVIRNWLIQPIVHRLPTSTKKISFDYKAKRFIGGADLPPLQRHHYWKVIFTEESKKELYSMQLRQQIDSKDPIEIFQNYFEKCDAPNMISKLQYVDTKVYLPDDILVKVDRMSMAHALEARVPLLDHKVVEFAASIPADLKLKGFTKKHILRKAMSQLLPPPIVTRKKAGFALPVSAWLKKDLKELALELLSPQEIKAQGFFNQKYVGQLIQQHMAGQRDNSRNIWGLMVFTLWYKTYIQNKHWWSA